MLSELSKKGDTTADARLVQVYAKLQEIEADKAEAKYLPTPPLPHTESLNTAVLSIRAAAILAGLGFPPAAQVRPTREFSGGWRMRTALARYSAYPLNAGLTTMESNNRDL